MMGASDADTITSLANRLARLNTRLGPEEQEKISDKAGGKSLSRIIHGLLGAMDGDAIEARAREQFDLAPAEEPTQQQLDQARQALVKEETLIFTGELCELIEGIRRSHEQIIDTHNLDSLTFAGWHGDSVENARKLTREFADYLQEHRDEITALSIFYDQPYRRRDLTFTMMREVLDRLKADRPKLAPLRVWQAYAQLDGVQGKSPHSELSGLVALIRRACGIDAAITPYDDTVRRNFQNWILQRHSGNTPKFNEEQMAWLRMIRDHIAASFHLERDDLEFAPFDAQGGLGRMYHLFGEEMEPLIDELNEALAA
jgi:type I restriction enzyme R subunit